MSHSRSDVQRLFGHFGLDPADYVVSFGAPTKVAGGQPARAVSAGVDNTANNGSERELFDYRNFELSR